MVLGEGESEVNLTLSATPPVAFLPPPVSLEHGGALHEGGDAAGDAAGAQEQEEEETGGMGGTSLSLGGSLTRTNHTPEVVEGWLAFLVDEHMVCVQDHLYIVNIICYRMLYINCSP